MRSAGAAVVHPDACGSARLECGAVWRRTVAWWLIR
jgi:hypothetical protein